MSRIEWNKPGERRYESGVDRGVYYPKNGPGVAWNGLVTVSEDSSGGELSSFYYDGVKTLDLISSEDFSATVEAYSVPREFDSADGRKQLSPGLFVTQQPRTTFGLSYRTLIGNDLLGSAYGYKLHLVYNALAAPTSTSLSTQSSSPDASTKTWSLSTVPPPASTFKPTAHLVVDSTLVDPYLMAELEAILYGRTADGNLEGHLPRLPPVEEIVQVLENPITEPLADFI